MAFAVVFYFESSTETRILDFQNSLIKAGINPAKIRIPLRPHITLGIYDTIDCDDCECRINEISFDLVMKSIEFISLGIFVNPDRVLFLSPVTNAILLHTHQLIHEELAPHTSGSWEIYKPGNWVPHCTIANDIEEQDLNKAVSVLADLVLPFKAGISQIGIVEFDPNQAIFQVDITE